MRGEGGEGGGGRLVEILPIIVLNKTECGGCCSCSSVVVDVNLTTEVSWGREERRGARVWVQKIHKYSRQVKFFTWKKLI